MVGLFVTGLAGLSSNSDRQKQINSLTLGGFKAKPAAVGAVAVKDLPVFFIGAIHDKPFTNPDHVAIFPEMTMPFPLYQTILNNIPWNITYKK